MSAEKVVVDGCSRKCSECAGASRPDLREGLGCDARSPKSAVLSKNGRYRFLLERELGGETTLGFVMLNPSTADAEIDDPTIRRCIGFARRWGYGRLAVANLFPLRATNPKALETETIAPAADSWNVYHLGMLAQQANKLVVAWGANKLAAVEVEKLLRLGILADRSLYCLGTTASGAPRHPLYVRGSTTPTLWRAAR